MVLLLPPLLFPDPGFNALAVAQSIRKKMEELKHRFPPDMKMDFSLDTTSAVTAGIDEIMHTFLEAVMLVILVVFIFLQDWRATLIPLLTVPVSQQVRALPVDAEARMRGADRPRTRQARPGAGRAGGTSKREMDPTGAAMVTSPRPRPV